PEYREVMRRTDKNAGSAGAAASERVALARTIGAATRRAEACWNFRDFFVTPAPLLVTAGQVLHDAGLNDQAVPLLEHAVKEPAWSRFTEARKAATRTLAIIALDYAQMRVMQAEHDATPTDVAQELARIALDNVARSTTLMNGGSDTGSWLEFRAHAILAHCYRKKNQNSESESEFQAAETALLKIEPRSRFHDEALKAL